MSSDIGTVQEVEQRLIDRFDPLELLELLNLTIEEVIDIFWDRIVTDTEIMEEIGYQQSDEE